MVFLSCGIGIRSGPRPRRLKQSAAVLNRSSGLRRIIFIHRCGPKGDECLTPKLRKRAIYGRKRAMKYHMDNRIVNKHCGGMGMNLLQTASGKVGDNDASATTVEGRLPK
jgi:hypothetical protein